MRIKHRYCKLNCFGTKLQELKSILNKYSIKYDYKEDNTVLELQNSIIFFVYEDMKDFDKIQYELKPFEIFSMIYTDWDKADMESAEWYEFDTGTYQYPMPDDDSGYLEQTFDLTHYCPECGIGKVQNNPFRLKHEPKQKNNQFWGLFWEYDAIFVHEETKNILQKENINGIHFIQPVLHKNSKPIDRFYQLIIENILDKGLDKSNVEKLTCKCGKIKYRFPKNDGCIFDKSIFSFKNDFYVTNDYFGSGGASAFRINIISKRVYEIVRKNKLKGLQSITPIRYKI
jgi:hypothetical protein